MRLIKSLLLLMLVLVLYIYKPITERMASVVGAEVCKAIVLGSSWRMHTRDSRPYISVNAFYAGYGTY